MKILLCLTLQERSLPSVPEEIESSDMILLAGDITLGAKSENVARKTMEKLGQLFPIQNPFI